mmetsp:Transcript_8499/g.33583  ORF Transcript_8499/g.33583 Transcript_8499/m.33583 type:complete len:270 (-) Transcript_8499:480-1289(-)
MRGSRPTATILAHRLWSKLRLNSRRSIASVRGVSPDGIHLAMAGTMSRLAISSLFSSISDSFRRNVATSSSSSLCARPSSPTSRPTMPRRHIFRSSSSSSARFRSKWRAGNSRRSCRRASSLVRRRSLARFTLPSGSGLSFIRTLAALAAFAALALPLRRTLAVEAPVAAAAALPAPESAPSPSSSPSSSSSKSSPAFARARRLSSRSRNSASSLALPLSCTLASASIRSKSLSRAAWRFVSSSMIRMVTSPTRWSATTPCWSESRLMQ